MFWVFKNWHWRHITHFLVKRYWWLPQLLTIFPIGVKLSANHTDLCFKLTLDYIIYGSRGILITWYLELWDSTLNILFLSLPLAWLSASLSIVSTDPYIFKLLFMCSRGLAAAMSTNGLLESSPPHFLFARNLWRSLFAWTERFIADIYLNGRWRFQFEKTYSPIE